MRDRIMRCMTGVFLTAVLLSATPAYANKLSEAMDSETWREEADELLLEKDGTLRRDAKKQVKKAWEKLKAGENERFRLAVLVQAYTEKGFDADLAAQYADDALLTTDYGMLYMNSNDREESAGGEDADTDQPADSYADDVDSDADQAVDSYADDVDAVSDLIACRGQAELEEVFARILETEDGKKRKPRLLEEMGQVLQGETKETVLPYALQAENADWDGAYLLHQVWVPDQSAADTAGSLCAMEDGPERSLLLEAAGMSFPDTDEMLQYLSSCAQLGIVPSACYPEGVELSLDLSGLNQHAAGRADIDQTRLLVLSRNEKTPGPVGVPFQVYEENQNLPDPEDCTIRLETAWMDTVPAECVPSSLDEVNTILLMDNQYYVSGTMTVETTTSFNGQTGDPSTNYYDVYSAVQVNSCFDWPSQSLLYSFGGHYTAPPEIPEEDKEDSSYGLSMTPDMVRKYYKAEMDPVWAADSMKEHLEVLSQNGWSTDITSENDRFSTISSEDWEQIIQDFYPGRAGWLNEDQFSVQPELDEIELDWASFGGSDICDSYYVIFWKVSGGYWCNWQVIAPGESTNFTFAAMPGVSYDIGIWHGSQTQPNVDASMEYYTTKVEFLAVSDDPADAGVIIGDSFIQVQQGDKQEPLEGALDPSVITQEGAEVLLYIPMEPVDGKGRDVRITYCLLSPEGYIYYSWGDYTMNDEQTLYYMYIQDLLKQGGEVTGGTVSSGEWRAIASIDGVFIEDLAFTVG